MPLIVFCQSMKFLFTKLTIELKTTIQLQLKYYIQKGKHQPIRGYNKAISTEIVSIGHQCLSEEADS